MWCFPTFIIVGHILSCGGLFCTSNLELTATVYIFIGIGFTFHLILNNNSCHNLSQSPFYSLHTVASVLGKLTFCETVVQDSCLNIGLWSNVKESYQIYVLYRLCVMLYLRRLFLCYCHGCLLPERWTQLLPFILYVLCDMIVKCKGLFEKLYAVKLLWFCVTLQHNDRNGIVRGGA